MAITAKIRRSKRGASRAREVAKRREPTITAQQLAHVRCLALAQYMGGKHTLFTEEYRQQTLYLMRVVLAEENQELLSRVFVELKADIADTRERVANMEVENEAET